MSFIDEKGEVRWKLEARSTKHGARSTEHEDKKSKPQKAQTPINHKSRLWRIGNAVLQNKTAYSYLATSDTTVRYKQRKNRE